jgi:15-cis-phytoene synthase
MSDRDAQVCRRIVREHARTFYLASVFLPAPKRRAAYALYAFCRVADDIVDRAERASAHSEHDAATVAAELAAHDRKMRDAMAGRPSDPVFRELHTVVRQFSVPGTVLQELMGGVAMDLNPTSYATWDELARYCEGVASSVGEMCTYVFGVPGGERVRTAALKHARTLGIAMQLTNILRDVGEDARRGRCYLPTRELAQYGLSADEILNGTLRATDQRWQRFMAMQIARARTLYQAAAPGIAMLSADAQRCAWACSVGYSQILSAIERIGMNSLEQRARLSTPARSRVLWTVWRRKPLQPASAAHPTSGGPHHEWTPVQTSSSDELVRLA